MGQRAAGGAVVGGEVGLFAEIGADIAGGRARRGLDRHLVHPEIAPAPAQLGAQAAIALVDVLRRARDRDVNRAAMALAGYGAVAWGVGHFNCSVS